MIFPWLERIFLGFGKIQKLQIINKNSKIFLKIYVRKKMKNQVTQWEKISASQIKNSGLASRTLKFLKISKKGKQLQYYNKQRIITRLSWKID